MQNFYILLAFLLITIALLIARSIYCYLIKYSAKQNIYYHLNSQITNEKKLKIKNVNQKAKDIDIKNHTYYFFDGIINIKNFDPNNIKITVACI